MNSWVFATENIRKENESGLNYISLLFNGAGSHHTYSHTNTCTTKNERRAKIEEKNTYNKCWSDEKTVCAIQ